MQVKKAGRLKVRVDITFITLLLLLLLLSNEYYYSVKVKKNFKNTLQLTIQNKNWCSAVQLVK